MFGFGEHQQTPVNCPCCQSPMQDMGAHGIRVGGLTGIGGAALGVIAGQLADDAEEAFEKKLKVQIFVCPQCSEVSFKYHGGL
ncbi:MAG: hypothetical protein OWQ56_06535 [Acidithiobacillus caldus]|nr:hypothetical protein [Acidithiobacillus caldus]